VVLVPGARHEFLIQALNFRPIGMSTDLLLSPIVLSRFQVERMAVSIFEARQI